MLYLGMADDQIAKLLRKHDKELEQLKEAQEQERENQKEHLRVSCHTHVYGRKHLHIFIDKQILTQKAL